MRTELGMPARAQPWAAAPGVECWGVPLGARERGILDCAWVARRRSCPPTATTQALRKGWWCNPSQGVERHPWGERPPTICRKSL
eukprot:7785267-Alexandrium_andersonii.AAC.1